MKKKSFDIQNSIKKLLPTESLPTGISLSDVVYVDPVTLVDNPLNNQLFKNESVEYFQRLKDDVKERGIIVPLIVKENGILLAGHNRKKIAIELELKKIPVQYVLNELAESEERAFLIKDNLLRRQLNSQEWIDLYKILYPDFDSQIQNIKRGRVVKDLKGTLSLLTNKPTISYEQIAQETGQNKEAVKKQIQRYKASSNRKDTSNQTEDLSAEKQIANLEKEIKKIIVKYQENEEVIDALLLSLKKSIKYALRKGN